MLSEETKAAMREFYTLNPRALFSAEILSLLSSPRVEDVRREAWEEAAKVADEVAADERAEKIADKEAEGKDYDPYSYGAGFLDGSWVTAQNIAKAIRSLSLPDGEGDKQARSPS